MKKKTLLAAVLFSTLVLAPSFGKAANLTVGARAEPAVDPHFLYVNTNIAYSRHLFDGLTLKDANAQPMAGLATSWKSLDEKTWEFKLRKGVKFHDGSDFTADDVIFTFNRVPNIPNNPNPYTPNMRSVAGIEKVDSHTIKITTKAPDPVLPATIAGIFIVSHKAAKDALPADFRSGKAAIGTGPYKFVSFTPGDRLVLARNDSYWGGKEPWERVTFRVMSNDASRMAALLAGDVDMVGNVPPGDVGRLQRDPNVTIFKRPSDRIIYMIMDVLRDSSPDITDKDGKPLAKNPLKDPKVRKALSMAIDRKLIVEKVMEGLATPASQLVVEGILGHNSALKVETYDPAAAKKLLAEAGWPNGFGLTVRGPNNRYVNDAKICEALGQMLAKIGLKVKVETEPLNVYFPKIKVSDQLKTVKYSFMMMGWGFSGTGDSSQFMNTVLHSYNKARRFGPGNRSGYVDAKLDKMIEDAGMTFERKDREKKLKDAIAYVTDVRFAIPLHYQVVVVGARKGVTVTPRIDEMLLAMEAEPAK